MRLLLTTTGVEALNQPVAGQGEFQDLVRKLQAQITGNMLLVAETDVEKLRSYTGAGDGDIGSRAAAILDGAEEETTEG